MLLYISKSGVLTIHCISSCSAHTLIQQFYILKSQLIKINHINDVYFHAVINKGWTRLGYLVNVSGLKMYLVYASYAYT